MQTDILQFVAVGLAAVSAVAGVVLLIPKRPRRRLAYWISTLDVSTPAAEKFDITFEGTVIQDPVVTTLRIVSIGRNDVTTNTFDAGNSLDFDFGVVPIGLLTQEGSVVAKAAGSQVQFPPQLWKPKEFGSLQLVFDGRPNNVSIKNSLINTQVVPLDPAKATIRRRGVFVSAASVALLLLGAAGLGAFASQRVPDLAAISLKDGQALIKAQTQRMSGPTLTSEQHGWYAPGGVLDLDCYERGQSVKGYYSAYLPGGWDNLWYKTADGFYIADVDINTRSNEPVVEVCPT